MKKICAEVVAWLKVLESSVLYATVLVTFGIQVARVDGQSMDPTLKDQDRLVVNKLAYHIGEPQPGDVVMMRYPVDPDKSFVKRMIAREGDTVQIVKGQVRVNGHVVPSPYVSGEHRSYDDWGPEVIPEGYCFVLGDNRSNSSDSRIFGFVPKKYIIAKSSCDGGRCPLQPSSDPTRPMSPTRPIYGTTVISVSLTTGFTSSLLLRSFASTRSA